MKKLINIHFVFNSIRNIQGNLLFIGIPFILIVIALIYIKQPNWLENTSLYRYNEIFFIPESFFSDIVSIAVWLIITEIIAFINIPITFLLFQRLPDKGIIFSKIIGLSFISILTWILTEYQIVSFNHFAIFSIILVIASINIILFIKYKHQIIFDIRSIKRILIIEECLFIILFLAYIIIRMYIPELYTSSKYLISEKPQDLKVLSGLLRSPYMPPLDPGLNGHYMNYYYYFGHFNVATLIKITQIPLEIVVNLQVAYFATLTSVFSFSIGYNLIGLTIKNIANRKMILCGVLLSICCSILLGGYLLNWLIYVVQFIINVTTILSIDIQQVPLSIYDAAHFVEMHSGAHIVTPFYTFLLGGMHSNSMGFHILLASYVINITYLISIPNVDNTIRKFLISVMAISSAIGSLTFSWDVFILIALPISSIIIKYIIMIYKDKQHVRDYIKQSIFDIAIFCVWYIAIISPFILQFQSDTKLIFRSPFDISPFSILFYYFLYFIMLAPLLSYLFRYIHNKLIKLMISWLYIIVFFIISIFISHTIGILIVALAIIVSYLIFFKEYSIKDSNTNLMNISLFMLFSLIICFGIFIGVNNLSINQYNLYNSPSGGNDNGMKAYTSIGILFAIVGVWITFLHWNWNKIWKASVVVLFILSLSLSLYAVFDRIHLSPRDAPITLNAMTTIKYQDTKTEVYNHWTHVARSGIDKKWVPGTIGNTTAKRRISDLLYEYIYPINVDSELSAINLINKEFSGNTKILETYSLGPLGFNTGGELSAGTGFPTILRSELHQTVYRGRISAKEIQKRISDIETIYNPGNVMETKKLLNQYGITHIYIGYTEWLYHGLDDIWYKFDKSLSDMYQVIYDNGNAKIYERNEID